MSEPKWTPGPWIVSKYKDFPPTVWDAAGNVRIAEFSFTGMGAPIARTTKANARLIAAAPELYDALLAMVYDYDDDNVRLQAFAALAKARGEP